MLFCGVRCLLHTALNIETPILQIGGKFRLQCPQTLVGIDFVGVERPVRRHRHMEEVHMRRFLIHVNHGGNDVLRTYEICKKGFVLFKKMQGILWGKMQEKSSVWHLQQHRAYRNG